MLSIYLFVIFLNNSFFKILTFILFLMQSQSILSLMNYIKIVTISGQEVALVLDLLNASSHQIDVQCGSGTGDGAVPVIIESQQCRR